MFIIVRLWGSKVTVRRSARGQMRDTGRQTIPNSTRLSPSFDNRDGDRDWSPIRRAFRPSRTYRDRVKSSAIYFLLFFFSFYFHVGTWFSLAWCGLARRATLQEAGPAARSRSQRTGFASRLASRRHYDAAQGVGEHWWHVFTRPGTLINFAVTIAGSAHTHVRPANRTRCCYQWFKQQFRAAFSIRCIVRSRFLLFYHEDASGVARAARTSASRGASSHSRPACSLPECAYHSRTEARRHRSTWAGRRW
jgi:hypothetical protein